MPRRLHRSFVGTGTDDDEALGREARRTPRRPDARSCTEAGGRRRGSSRVRAPGKRLSLRAVDRKRERRRDDLGVDAVRVLHPISDERRVHEVAIGALRRAHVPARATGARAPRASPVSRRSCPAADTGPSPTTTAPASGSRRRCGRATSRAVRPARRRADHDIGLDLQARERGREHRQRETVVIAQTSRPG